MTRPALTSLAQLVTKQVEAEGLRPLASRMRLEVGSLRGALDSRNLTHDTIKSLTDALGLEFYIGPPRDAATLPTPEWSRFATTTLPHHGVAKCSIQGWGKDQPDRDPLPKPEDSMDDSAFYVSATGQSMIPEGIDSGAICLVSPGTEPRPGDRVWFKDKAGATAIKRLVRISERGAFLRGWMPIKDGKQQSFEEERFLNFVEAMHPVIAVFKGKPGNDNCKFIPDPKPPAHAEPPVATLHVPKAITDLLGLPEGADAAAVLAAMRTQLADRGTAAASPSATLDKRTLDKTLDSKLKSETRSVLDELAEIKARLPAVAESNPAASPDPGGDEAASGERLSRLRFVRDVHAAAGTGEDVFEESEISILIPTDALPPRALVEQLIALRSAGASMEPTIRNGDLLVLDRSAVDPQEGRIFVLRTGTGLVVKRLKRTDGVWLMASDNAEWKPRPIGAEDRVLGHVVWFGPEKAVEVGG